MRSMSGRPRALRVLATTLLVATTLVARSAAAAERAGGSPDSSPDLTEVFLDGFESGGACNWVGSSPCTLYIITIPNGAAGGDHHFPPLISIDLGATVRFYNADVDWHRIHGYDPGCGFPHEADPGMGQGESWDVTPTCLGDFNYYCHSHPGQGAGMVHVR